MFSAPFVFGFVAAFAAPGLCCRGKEFTTRDGRCCPMCHEGTVVRRDCTSQSRTQCVPCEDGTFMNKPSGLTRCFPCTTCDPGLGLFEKQQCTATTDAVCDVLSGYFCQSLSDDATGCSLAQKHKDCKPGQRIKEPGTSRSDTVCEDCQPGYFSEDGVTCTVWTVSNTFTCHRAEYQIGNECCPMCPAGSRVKTDCTEFRSTSCLPCLEGTFMNQPTGFKNCLSCKTCDTDAGLKIKSPCTSTSDTVCEAMEGFYCVESTDDDCVTAQEQPGQYISQEEFVTAFMVPELRCPEKKYAAQDGNCCSMCHEGTVVRRDCTSQSRTQCVPCEDGTFMNKPSGLTRCFPCTTCDPGLGLFEKQQCTATTDAVCDVLSGYFCQSLSDDATGCSLAQKHKDCKPGQRIKEPGTSRSDTVCEDCQPGYFSEDGVTCTVWTVSNTFTCHRAEYQIGNECCPMCPAGSRVKTDCTEFRSTSCLPCLEGTFMNQPTGFKNCLSCKTCDTDAGLKIKSPCTSTSDTVCEAMEGFYCVESTDDDCVTAQEQPGQYISQEVSRTGGG